MLTIMITTNWRDPIDDYYDSLEEERRREKMGWQPKEYSFDAKQARDLSSDLDVHATVEKVLTGIKNAAKRGYKACSVYDRDVVGFEPIHRVVQEELRGLGFQVVVHSDQRDGDYVEVSWK